MRPGDTVRIIKGEYEGRQAHLRNSDAFFYHVQLLYPNGRKVPHKIVTLHRSYLAPLETVDG